MARRVLLQLLSDGEFHSGQELADCLGVSRTAVWKQLGKLEELGLVCESVKGRGYRLPGGLQLLEADAVRDFMSPESLSLLAELRLLDTIDSTNAELMRELEAQSARAGTVCSAEQQTSGRGRRGRQWVSPYGGNIYLSVAWSFDGGAAVLEGLSLAVAVAVSDALTELGLQNLQLKWPNDLLVNDAKLGGILIEMVGDVQDSLDVVVGIGINVRMPALAAGNIDQTWTDLEKEMPEGVNRNQLLGGLLSQLLPLLDGYQASGFAPWRERWLSLDAFADESVVISSGERKLAGTARGIDEQGALLLETSAGIKSIHGGELSLRKAT